MKSAHPIIDVVSKLVVLVLLVAAIVFMFTYVAPKTHQSIAEAQFVQYRSAARLYEERMYDFHGVCKSVQVGPRSVCTEDGNGYRIVTKIATGKYQCTDMRGFSGEITQLPDNQHSCQ